MMCKLILTSVAAVAAQYAFAITACVDGKTAEAAGARVSISEDGDVRVWATNAISTVTLSWEADFAPTAKVLGDAWERTYGDTYWRGICERRDMPWYFLLSEGARTEGWGVETQPNALAMWRATTNRVDLVIDVRAGGRPVELKGRTLEAVRIVRGKSAAGESAWDFGRRFCKMMCPRPRLPKEPVYGYNDWYCAYGKNTATNFLADAAMIVSLCEGLKVRPYVVMDDGWQRNSPPVVGESGRGPWDRASANFGMAMPEFAEQVAALGAKPGLWHRPLRAWDEAAPDERLKADGRFFDPSVASVRTRIYSDMRRFRDWGFKLVKIDFLTHDICGIWPCDFKDDQSRLIRDDREWRDHSRTTAEVMKDLYCAMREGAGDDVVIIGCNALNHLSAGLFEVQRTGNDTSGKNWAWTRNHGVNTLAMRSIQDGAFFKIDGDCVGLAEEGAVPWRLNRQWMDLLGRSGTPFFVSWRRQLAGPEVRKSLADAFRRASSERPTIEPVDWQKTCTPRQWRDANEAVAYEWDCRVTRIFRPPRFERGMLNQEIVQPIDEAAWIWHPDVPEGQPVCADIGAFFKFRTGSDAKTDAAFLRFRKDFESDGSTFTVDVSADERFVLFLDGEFIARGPNRGWTENWQYQTYELKLVPGRHVLEAVVLRLGAVAPITQMSYRGGFTLKASGAYDAKLTTGRTDWQVGALSGTAMSAEFVGHGAMGTRTTSRGTGFEDELPREWKKAVVVAQPIRQRAARFNWGLRRPGWMLYPSEIPDQVEVVRRPGAFKGEWAESLAPLLAGKSATIPPRTTLKAFWDLDDYYCYYPNLRVCRGRGAKVRLSYAEALVDAKRRKGNRGEWKGRDVDPKHHMYDDFLCDGRDGARFTSPWWRCGRWIVVEIETGDEPLEVLSLAIRETRYPCEMKSVFETPDDPSLAAIQRVCLRSMQCCDHEMLMDCPFYEQQMYPADTRVQMLTLTALSDDDRMIRRGMEIYDLGRRDDGLVPNNWPTRNFQESQVMSLNYLMMYGDYVRWHRNDAWLKARFPGAMNTLLAMKRQENADGLLENVIGSPFIDWVDEWGEDPIPVGAGEGPSALVNLYYVHAMRSVAELAAAVGEPELADYWRAKAERTGRKIVEKFWVAEKGLLADDIGHTKFSEHAQVFAILGDVLHKEKEDPAFSHLLDVTPLARVTVYSLHYLFEAFYRHDRGDLILARLDLWRDYLKAGLRTCLETPVTYPTQRSDCHAWGSHPIYHLRASVAGIRPSAPGFARVRIAPSPGALKEIHATMPHPLGRPVEVALKFDSGRASGVITTPVAGEFLWKGDVIVLHEGENRVNFK